MIYYYFSPSHLYILYNIQVVLFLAIYNIIAMYLVVPLTTESSNNSISKTISITTTVFRKQYPTHFSYPLDFLTSYHSESSNNSISKTISKTFFIFFRFFTSYPPESSNNSISKTISKTTTAFTKQYKKHLKFSSYFLLLTPQKAATTAFLKQYAKQQQHF